MFFFRYLFYNQYADISRRGGNARQAQFNTILLSTAVITLFIIICFVAYNKVYPGFLEKNFAVAAVSGKAIGKLLAAVIGLILFFALKFFIGSKPWYDKRVGEFENMNHEEQDQASKKGLRYFFIASAPTIIFIVWALLSLF